MRLLRKMLEAQPTVEAGLTPRAAGESDSLKLTKLHEKDDVEAYLTTFERLMAAYEVPKKKWSYKLAPQLTGKAQQAFAAMTPEEASSYDRVKQAIFLRYNITEETYRHRF